MFSHISSKPLLLLYRKCLGIPWRSGSDLSYFPVHRTKCRNGHQLPDQVAEKGCIVCKKNRLVRYLVAGMVHPNVLENCGIDSNKYTGLCFGMVLNGINHAQLLVKDLRLLQRKWCMLPEAVHPRHLGSYAADCWNISTGGFVQFNIHCFAF